MKQRTLATREAHPTLRGIHYSQNPSITEARWIRFQTINGKIWVHSHFWTHHECYACSGTAFEIVHKAHHCFNGVDEVLRCIECGKVVRSRQDVLDIDDDEGPGRMPSSKEEEWDSIWHT